MRSRLKRLYSGPSSPTASERDPTKTRPYAWLDLTTKAISSVALVVLGISGACFQLSTQRMHDKEAQAEKAERGYLAEFQTLVELEMVLEEARSTLPISTWLPPDDMSRFAASTPHLKFAAYALYFPEREASVVLRYPVPFARWRAETVEMPLRGAILMLAHLGSGHEMFARIPPDAVASLVDNHLIIQRPGGSSLIITLPADEIPAWRAWLDVGGLSGAVLRRVLYRQMIDDLLLGIAQIIHGVIATRPQLADRYVVIRRETEALAAKHSSETNHASTR
jgi:hypothetical protein